MQPGQQGPDLRALAERTLTIRDRLATAVRELSSMEAAGSAGGDAVVITMRGTGEFIGVQINPSAADPDDVEALERLVLAAAVDAQAVARARAEDIMRGGAIA
jgi:DNA-binding protein YbaB